MLETLAVDSTIKLELQNNLKMLIYSQMGDFKMNKVKD